MAKSMEASFDRRHLLGALVRDGRPLIVLTALALLVSSGFAVDSRFTDDMHVDCVGAERGRYLPGRLPLERKPPCRRSFASPVPTGACTKVV